MKNIIIGTAGHIDHGKTTLIKALTGRDTDRLKEEKKRGISIDLGFTHFDIGNEKRVGIIDVPGHEKFLKNMLAGIAGMDLVILVVAADEGVMPQTREHLDILNLIGIEKGIIVITKADLVEEDFLELVTEEIKEEVKGTFLENADVLAIDSISKRGINELIFKIDEMTEEMNGGNTNSPARLYIDRVFTIKGFGTVVTGTLVEGRLKLDDEVKLYPSGMISKVRGIQVHGSEAKEALAGQRVAINLSNIKVADVKRGDILGALDIMTPSMMIDAKVTTLCNISKSIEYWDRVRIYHGAREILGRIVPLGKDEIKTNEEGFVQIRLEESLASKKMDRFIIRTYSPMETVGGGIILDPNPTKHKKNDISVIEQLALKEKGEFKDIVENILQKNSKLYMDLKKLREALGEEESNIKETLDILIQEKRVISLGNYYFHIEHYEFLKKKVSQVLNQFHKENSLKAGIAKEELRSKIDKNLKIREFDELLEKLIQDGSIQIENALVKKYGFEVVYTKEEELAKNKILDMLNSSELAMVLYDELVARENLRKNVLEAMIGKEVQLLGSDLVMKSDEIEKIKEEIKIFIEKEGDITAAQLRDALNTSRKIAIVILEYMDRIKFTKRIEDKRILS